MSRHALAALAACALALSCRGTLGIDDLEPSPEDTSEGAGGDGRGAGGAVSGGPNGALGRGGTGAGSGGTAGSTGSGGAVSTTPPGGTGGKGGASNTAGSGGTNGTGGKSGTGGSGGSGTGGSGIGGTGTGGISTGGSGTGGSGTGGSGTGGSSTGGSGTGGSGTGGSGTGGSGTGGSGTGGSGTGGPPNACQQECVDDTPPPWVGKYFGTYAACACSGGELPSCAPLCGSCDIGAGNFDTKTAACIACIAQKAVSDDCDGAKQCKNHCGELRECLADCDD